MSKFKQVQNWRSTLAGLALILNALAHVRTFADLTHADVFGGITTGLGLILCADARKEDSTDAGEKK